MDPQQELAQWVAFRHQFEQQYPGQAAAQAPAALIDQYNGKGLSPAAYALYKTGNGSQHYDISQGAQGGLANDKGWFSHPESWLQLGFGGALGAGALGAFGGAGSAAGAGASGASKNIGDVAGGTGAFDDSGNWIYDSPAGSPMATAANAANTIGNVAGGTGHFDNAGNWVADAASNANWSTLLKAIAGIGGLAAGKLGANAGMANAVPPQLNQLLDLSMQRANAQTPLFNAAQSGLYQMLPDFAKKGGS